MAREIGEYYSYPQSIIPSSWLPVSVWNLTWDIISSNNYIWYSTVHLSEFFFMNIELFLWMCFILGQCLPSPDIIFMTRADTRWRKLHIFDYI